MKNIYHVIKDPVHGTMQFTSQEDNWIKPFIDSAHFQRLRTIKQLGMEDYIFPGAMHTRFNHCLGCCYIASQIAHKIGLSDSERQLVMIACLLHDIGHGPFSHTFEDIFQQKAIRHEDWTPYFLKDYTHDRFFEDYNRLNPQFMLDQQTFHHIEAMIMHKLPIKNVLSDIVSSQLDADRLDYLLRDSHFCGVRYGEYDLPWMLHCMTIVLAEEGPRLGITHKGIGVVEHYLMARRLMTRNIYHSQKKLALENFLIQMLNYVAQELATYAPYKTLRHSRLGEFLLAVNLFNQELISKSDFLAANYELYKGLRDDDIFALIRYLASLEDTHAATQLATRLNCRLMPKVIRLDYKDPEAKLNLINEFKATHHKEFADWQITLIKTPHRSYSGEEDPILVSNERTEVKPLSDFSLMINAISDKLEHITFLAIDKVIVNDARIARLINQISR
jgi:uncharacterized protein